MKNYAVHDMSGKILRTGICPDDMIEIQAQEGESVIEAIANDTTDWIDIETSQVIKKPNQYLDIEKNEHKQRKDKQDENKLITAKKQEIITRMAIEELKKEGKIKEVLK
jgi:hypothetical protein